MAVEYVEIDVAERKVRGGGVRPGFKYTGIKEGSLRGDSLEHFVEDITSVTSGDVKSLASKVEKALNRLSAAESNPFASDEYKLARNIAKLSGKSLTAAQTLKLAEKIRNGEFAV